VLGAAVLAGLASSVAGAQETASPAGDEPAVSARQELTGDWGGARTRWKDHGFDADLSLTQFYQALVDGGVDTGSEYNGTAQAKFDLDLGKLAGWRFWSTEVKAESRFGGPLLVGTGGINPVNTAAIVPGADGTVAAISALNFTRLIPLDLEKGNLVVVSFGRYNLLDLLDEDFFAGGGTDRFMNIAQIGPLTVLRQVPLITNAVNLAYVRGGEPIVTFSIMDPNDHSTNAGLSDLFADGVTFAPGVNIPTKYFGKSGKHTFGGAITTKEYTPFDAIKQIILPGPPLHPVEPQSGSWSLSYTFRQSIVERGSRDGWGFFTQLSFADQATSPITRFADAGLGGNGLFASRSQDEFGIAYAYTELSSVLRENLDLLPLGGSLRPEHQVELFYDCHITPWLQLTGDLQIIRPVRPIADTAIVPGVRLKVVF